MKFYFEKVTSYKKFSLSNMVLCSWLRAQYVLNFFKWLRKKLWYDAIVEINFKGPYFLTDGNASALEKQLMLKPQNWLESTNRHSLLGSANDFDLQEWFHVVKKKKTFN